MARNCALGQTPSRCAVLKSCNAQLTGMAALLCEAITGSGVQSQKDRQFAAMHHGQRCTLFVSLTPKAHNCTSWLGDFKQLSKALACQV